MLVEYVNIAFIILSTAAIIWFVLRSNPTTNDETTHTVYEVNEHLVIALNAEEGEVWGCLSCGRWSGEKEAFEECDCYDE